MENEKDIAKLNRRYARLAARLARTGHLLQGTITERYLTRDKDGETITTGPYYQWTFKRNAKTVTVNLSASQAKRFQKAIDDNRLVEQTLNEMRELSREILDATTKGVTRRK